eukprot:gene12735-biopygen7328
MEVRRLRRCGATQAKRLLSQEPLAWATKPGDDERSGGAQKAKEWSGQVQRSVAAVAVKRSDECDGANAVSEGVQDAMTDEDARTRLFRGRRRGPRNLIQSPPISERAEMRGGNGTEGAHGVKLKWVAVPYTGDPWWTAKGRGKAKGKQRGDDGEGEERRRRRGSSARSPRTRTARPRLLSQEPLARIGWAMVKELGDCERNGGTKQARDGAEKAKTKQRGEDCEGEEPRKAAGKLAENAGGATALVPRAPEAPAES